MSYGHWPGGIGVEQIERPTFALFVAQVADITGRFVIDPRVQGKLRCFPAPMNRTRFTICFWGAGSRFFRIPGEKSQSGCRQVDAKQSADPSTFFHKPSESLLTG